MMFICLVVYISLLLLNVWMFPNLGANAAELIDFGVIYAVYIALFALMSEAALRGFVFKRLLERQKMSFWAATAITSLLYIMFVYGNGRPYTFIDRSPDLLLYDSLSKVVFSVVACGVYAQKRSLFFVILLAIPFYLSLFLN